MTATHPPVTDLTTGAAAHNGVSRRTVVRAGGWSIPVVAVATAAPAFAASVDPRGTLGIIPERFTGVRDYTPSTGAGRVTVTALRVRNNGPSAVPAGVLTYTLTIPEEWGTFTSWAGSTPSPAGWTIDGYGTTTLTLAPTSTARGLAVAEEFDLTAPSSAGGRSLVFLTTRRFNGANNAATTGDVVATVATTKAVPNEFAPDSSSAAVIGGRWPGA